MATETRGRNSVERALGERAGAVRYDLRQREIRRGKASAARPGPLEFDALGFPIPQPISGFVQRVSRLINAS